MNRLAELLREALITCCGLGHAPVASGTFGTLGGVALAGLAGALWPEHYLAIVLGLAVALLLLGAPLGGWAERKWARKDPGQYVLDEVVGYLVTVAWPVFPGWTHLGLGFLLFRIADIVKPPPARRLERVPGGWGILLDDVAAGVWALLALILLRNVFPDLLGPA
ncbi:MAG: phosphatidylglycerophosphatase A [Planctomycetes bacterium]|nr:phosphatidylglycerophosphatase A [Planctomycetota bacterium]MBL7008995.1 phosphatidylglycerophosphatase A [Planctomycetota bacterium]